MKMMNLNRLEDFTPKVALKALMAYMPKSDLRHLKISTRNLNKVKEEVGCDNIIQYVFSIGDRLYQIAAVDERLGPGSYVVVKDFQLCVGRRRVEGYNIKLKDFTPEVALTFLKKEYERGERLDTKYSRLTLSGLTQVRNGISDSNMVKYVTSVGYGLFQVAAIENGNLTYLMETYSRI